IAAGLLAALTAPADAYIRFNCATNIVEERADPLVDPYKVSGHVHKIAGGNAWNMNRYMDYDELRSAKCSSCLIKQDLSNYWTPKLYYHAQNGSFINVPMVGDSASDLNGGMVVYYQQRGPDTSNLTAFPEGFRMLAGDTTKRNFTGDFPAEAVNFACLGSNQPETNYLPNYNCPDGLRAQLYFPSCWNGEVDSPDHKSHMSYPASGAHDNGPCPASHPTQTISLFFEVLYASYLFADDWYGDKQPFVFSNGDPTGYGFHGDFLNGWEVEALQQVTDQCNSDAAFGSTAKSDCPPIDEFTSDEMMNCKVPSQVDEPIRGVLSKLPGCNPVQYGPAPAKMATCSGVVTTISSDTQVEDATFTDETGKGWSYVGCATDSSTTRTFDGATTIYSAGVGDTMTVDYCLNFCKDYTYAGIEYGSQCYCGNTLASAAAPKAGELGSCNMPCNGNSTQFCGGNWALSSYKKCSGSSC
ncbi:WSC-domain-containing protein, partial [Rhizodiscina lignyota]